MKIVHLNTYDGNGGAGRACMRLNKALREQGIDSELWVNFKFGNQVQVRTFSGNKAAYYLTAFGILLERYTSSFLTKKLKTPFSVPVWGRDISKHPALLNADIIHIHWINHGFLRPEDLAKLSLLNKPIVWTFHDSNAFTGGCHVRYSCNHFVHECGNCPLLKASGPDDRSHQIWNAKQDAYKTIDFSVIAPSRWMKASVERSKLAGSNTIYNIPNTLDTRVFKPVDKPTARTGLNLSADKFIILSGFMPSKNDLHKGTPYLLEALELLAAMVGKDNIELLIFGNRDEKSVPVFPVKTTFLGTISSDEKLAACYSAADVFVTPSLEDNLPNTVMESLSCATPVVAFTTGGIPDMVSHFENGYLAEYKSSADLAKGIQWVFNLDDRELVNRNARKTIEDKFSEAVIGQKHIDLYKSLIYPAGDPVFKNSPVLSVITVVYNDVKNIERTMQSVLRQSYQHIEYIVIDGASVDGTLDIINKYNDKIILVSEKDQGIYDAMNKGLARATGDYVLFMNSGDELYAADTVEQVFGTFPGADIYYGETEMIDQNLNSLGRRRHKAPANLTFRSFEYGMSVSHQAIYIKRSLAGRFDLRFQLSSDIDWILTAVKGAHRIVNANKYVARYMIGGMSKQKHRQSLAERFKIFSKHYGPVNNLINHAVIALNLGWYYSKNRRTND